MKLKNYTPLWRQVLLKDVTKTKTDSGIILTERDIPFNVYEVVAAGSECLEVKKGDKVVLPLNVINHIAPLELEGVKYVQGTEQLIIGKFD